MNKLVNCKSCQSEIAKGAKACPKCGKDNRNFFAKHKIITGIGVIVILAVVASAIGGNHKSADSATSTPAPKKSDSKVNYENFMNIKLGSSYEDIKAVLGDGEQQSTIQIGNDTNTTYTFKGDGLDDIVISFTGDKATSKSQIGLKKTNKVALDQFNKVENGMTLNQVQDILGEGALESESEIMNIEDIVYSWANGDGSNMNITIQNDKVSSKFQVGLK